MKCSLLILLLPIILFAEISDVNEEGNITKIANYSHGSGIHDDKFFTNTHSSIEKYQIEPDGSLSFICEYPMFDMLITFTVIGDSIYTIIDRTFPPYYSLQIYDISSEDFLLTQEFEIPEVEGYQDKTVFIYNDDYVVIPATGLGYDPELVYDRSTHELMPLYFDVLYPKLLVGNYLFDIGCTVPGIDHHIQIRDISSLNNPLPVYEFQETIYLPAFSYVTAINDTVIAITTNDYQINPTHTKLISISDIYNPYIISEYTLNYTGDIIFDRPPLVVDQEFIYYTGWSQFERILYSVSDLENPYEESSWVAPNGYWCQCSLATCAWQQYFYEMSGDYGIIKYDTNNLPIIEPDDFYGSLFSSLINYSFCNSNLVYKYGNKIFSQVDPDQEPIILYVSDNLFQHSPYYLCMGSKTLIAVPDDEFINWEVNIVETETGNILNTENFLGNYGFFQYVSPHIYFEIDNDQSEVYLLTDQNTLQYISAFETSSSEMIYDTGKDFFWLKANDGYIHLHDTNTLEELATYPISQFNPHNLFFSQSFFEDYVIVYEFYDIYNDPPTEMIAQLFYHPSPDTLELIDVETYYTFTKYYELNGEVVKIHGADPMEFCEFSLEGFTETYYSYSVPYTARELIDAGDNRFYATNNYRLQSYEYDYESSSVDYQLLNSDCNLSNHPNPFNPTTAISFSIQNDSNVELAIYNIKGQKIKTLVQNEFTMGNHSIVWNGNDESSNPVSSGIYYYELNVNGKTKAVKKCLLLK